jgi:protocatechuate 3,4-dioxygenase beta subunit
MKSTIWGIRSLRLRPIACIAAAAAVLMAGLPSVAKGAATGGSAPAPRQLAHKPTADTQPVIGHITNGKAGLIVLAVSAEGNLLAETRSQAGGYYVFDKLGATPAKIVVLDEQRRPISGAKAEALTEPCAPDKTPQTAPVTAAVMPERAAVGARRETLRTSSAPVSGPVIASANAGGITGTVTNAAGQPLQQVDVRVYSGTAQVAAVFTSADGQYTVAGLVPGNYRVFFNTNVIINFVPSPSINYLSEFYNDKATLDTADIVTVANDPVTNINAVLTLGGAIIGTFKSALDGSNLSGTVYVYTSTTAPGAFAFEAANVFAGNYVVQGLPAGNYYLEFSPTGSSYLDEYYDDQRTPESATPIAVSAAATQTANALLDYKPELSGRVTDANNTPLQGVSVYLYTQNSNVFGGTYKTVTGAGGYYTVTGLNAGVAYIGFVAPPGFYLDQFYSNQSSLSNATPITLTLNTTATNINAQLAAGGVITGRVTAPGGVPLQGVFVSVYGRDECGRLDSRLDSEFTDANGFYRFEKLTAGDYFVEYSPSFGANSVYLREFFDDKGGIADATPIAVTGRMESIANAELARGGSITGRVTAADTGLPLPGAQVFASRIDVGATSVGFGSADANGFYTLTGMLAGSYRVEFSPPDETAYIREYYSKTGFLQATPVAVSLGGTTANINAALTRGAQFTGRVQASGTLTNLRNVNIYAYTSLTNSIFVANTDASGEYTTTGLPAGSYKVFFEPVRFSADSRDYVQQFFNGKGSFAGADPIALTAGNLTPNINASLARGGMITGTVVLTNGQPADVFVSAYDSSNFEVSYARTAPDGSYELRGLPSGAHRVYFDESSMFVGCGVTPVTFQGVWYNQKSTFETANPVNVTAPDVAPGIDAVISAGGPVGPAQRKVHLPTIRK